MDMTYEEIDKKILDFHDNSKQVIILESIFYHVCDHLDKEELRYLVTHTVTSEYMNTIFNDNKVELTEEDVKRLSNKKFYLTFVDTKFDVNHLLFSFNYVPLTINNEAVEIIF